MAVPTHAAQLVTVPPLPGWCYRRLFTHLAKATTSEKNMASSLLALIDDIATILDDVALLSKVAAKKTAGVLGDDLALNAQQVSGVKAERELPVVWAVARGSFINKVILVPAALAISAFIPWAVTPLLMLGGAFLCFEGFEKLAHKLLHSPAEEAAEHAALTHALADPAVDLREVEKDKIKGAVRTDFILSAEIVAITLGTVQTSPFMTQLTVLSTIALVMTVGVYGLVAGIVKLDDGGLYLSQRTGAGAWAGFQRSLGAGILRAAPWLMKGLSVAGTAAMFLVGGGILTHGLGWLHHAIEGFTAQAGTVNGIGPLLAAITPLVLDALVGILAGAMVLLAVTLFKRMSTRRA
jgi:predicted DNA repair protein MutK